ncbi:MAG TPA: hypothetical protein VFU49_17275 [Ktedonobacteraceae bacterium]|nr:hypothetical protein [Ktedonobacteraceae bacterium]
MHQHFLAAFISNTQQRWLVNTAVQLRTHDPYHYTTRQHQRASSRAIKETETAPPHD